MDIQNICWHLKRFYSSWFAIKRNVVDRAGITIVLAWILVATNGMSCLSVLIQCYC